MQDRYAGDIGDYGKYGLLRWLCRADEHGPALSLGVLWYLVPNGSGTDGSKIGYLTKPGEGLRGCDEPLFLALGKLVAERQRSVAAVEALEVLPDGARFFARPITAGAADRQMWVEEGLRMVEGADVVFADPDNGLRDAAAYSGGVAGMKHAYYQEIEPCWARGQSLVIYQHTARNKNFEGQTADRIRDLRAHLDDAPSPIVLRWRREVSRAFFILPAPQHKQRLTARVEALLNSQWGQRQPGFATPHFERVTM